MRIVNFILLTAINYILFWAASLDAQQSANLPYVYQSTHSVALECGTNTLCFANNINAANDVVVCVGNWDSQGTLAAIQFADTGSLLTFTMEPAIAGANNTLAGGASAMASQLGYAIASGSGSTSIIETQSPAFPRQSVVGCVEIPPPAGGGLAFDAHAEGPACSGTCPPSNTGNTTLNITTTQQNDVVICALAAPSPGSNNLIWSPATNSVAPQFGWVTGNVANPTIVSWGIAGAAGAQTCKWNVNNNGAGTTALNYFTPLAIAFKQTSLAIGTSKLPDGAAGTAYSATMTAVGGSGSYTWSIVSGSCGGLSMSAGGVLSGTPSTAGQHCVIGVKVTDGTNTATRGFGFSIGASFNVIAAPVCTTYSTNPGGHTIAGVSGGDSLWVFPLEIDTHGQDAQINPASDMTDSCGDQFTIASPVLSGQQGGVVIYSAIALCGGTVGLSQTLPGGVNPTPLAGVFCDIKGAQAIADTMSTTNSQPTGTSTTLTTSFTTPVANEMILGVSALDSSGSVALQAPCTVVTTASSIFANVSICQETQATPGAYNVSSNYSDSGNFNTTTPLLVELGLRPSIPASSNLAGEPRKRHPE